MIDMSIAHVSRYSPELQFYGMAEMIFRQYASAIDVFVDPNRQSLVQLDIIIRCLMIRKTFETILLSLYTEPMQKSSLFSVFSLKGEILSDE